MKHQSVSVFVTCITKILVKNENFDTMQLAWISLFDDKLHKKIYPLKAVRTTKMNRSAIYVIIVCSFLIRNSIIEADSYLLPHEQSPCNN